MQVFALGGSSFSLWHFRSRGWQQWHLNMQFTKTGSAYKGTAGAAPAGLGGDIPAYHCAKTESCQFKVTVLTLKLIPARQDKRGKMGTAMRFRHSS